MNIVLSTTSGNFFQAFFPLFVTGTSEEDVSSCKVQIQSLSMDNKAITHMDTDMDSSPVEMEASQLSAVSPEDLLVSLGKMLIAPLQ